MEFKKILATAVPIVEEKRTQITVGFQDNKFDK